MILVSDVAVFFSKFTTANIAFLPDLKVVASWSLKMIISFLFKVDFILSAKRFKISQNDLVFTTPPKEIWWCCLTQGLKLTASQNCKLCVFDCIACCECFKDTFISVNCKRQPISTNTVFEL